MRPPDDNRRQPQTQGGAERLPLSPEQIEQLHDETGKQLLVWFRERVNDPEIAKDLLADTWERALKALPSYRGGPGREAAAWLWTIASHLLSEYNDQAARESRVWNRLGRKREETNDPNIDQITERDAEHQFGARIAKRLQDLPEPQREALRLHVIEQLSYEHIAQRMATTEDNTRARVSRALRRLGADLRADYESWRRDNG